MKNTLFLLTVIILLSHPLLAQQDQYSQYDTWVVPMNTSLGKRGFLYELKDSSVILSNVSNFSSPKMSLREFPVTQIQKIQVNKRHRALKGAGIGVLAAFGVGLVVGLADKEQNRSNMLDFTPGELGLLTGLILIPPSAMAGALIGSITTKIPINGSFDSYQKQKQKLLRYSRQ